MRSSNGEMPDLRSIACGFLPLHFLRWPTDRLSGIGQCPTGRRRMRKSGEASCGRRANFNCELNLPDDCRMSAGWVLYRRITVLLSTIRFNECNPAYLKQMLNTGNNSFFTDQAIRAKIQEVIASSTILVGNGYTGRKVFCVHYSCRKWIYRQESLLCTLG